MTSRDDFTVAIALDRACGRLDDAIEQRLLIVWIDQRRRSIPAQEHVGLGRVRRGVVGIGA